MKNSFDVLITGGGLAGGTLARQINLQLPHLSVGVIEKKENPDDWKVGEATVEIAANYFCRRLNLTNYLYRNHLPKNGLRYFFDSKEKNLSFENLSEMGTSGFPEHPSFLIDRIVFEKDLKEMNKDSGTNYFSNYTCKSYQKENDLHKVTATNSDGEQETISGRWIIDATGRGKFLSKQLGIKTHKETRLNTAAIWGRFSNIKDLDLEGSNEWKERVSFSPRMMATIHLMYDGYWIWIIPVANEVYSIGVVFDRDRLEDAPTKKGFEEFLRSHKALDEIMEKAKMLDFKSYSHLPYYVDQYFSEDKWALTGEAGCFEDPFYSPGSDFIGLSNDLIVDLIESSLTEKKIFTKKVEQYEQFYKDRYQRTMRIYIDNYKYFGSFDVMSKKYFMDLCHYYNLFFWPYKLDHHLDLKLVKKSNLEFGLADDILKWQEHLLEDYYQWLEKENRYFTNNKDQFNNVSRSTGRIFGLLAKKHSEEETLIFLKDTLAIPWLQILEEVHGEADLATDTDLLQSISLPWLLAHKNPLSKKSLDKILRFKRKAQESREIPYKMVNF
jgi:flavin-dependent dehydrogenase